RDPDESHLIRDYIAGPVDRAHSFFDTHSTQPWQPWQVDWMHRATLWDHNPVEATLFTSGSLADHEVTGYFLILHTVGGISKDGLIEFISGYIVSYFDSV